MKKADIWIIVIGIVTAVLLFAGIHWVHKDKGSKVEVLVNGEVAETFSLSDSLTYEIQTEGGTNLLNIQNGKVQITDADCPDKICVKHAAISKSGESIICLPHKLVVQITGGSESETDAIVQ